MSAATNHAVDELVLVVTADDLLADAIDHVLQATGTTVRRATRGGVEPAITELRPALVILDAGDEPLAERPVAVSRVRQASDVPLVVLTRTSRVEDRLAAFEAGADDVLALPVPLAELGWKCTTMMRRAGRQLDVLELGDVCVDMAAHLVERNGVFVELTALEFSLLVALGRHRGAVLSKTQLLTIVWGFDHHDVNLVEVHVSALRRKLEAVGPRIVHTVRGVGYVLRPAEPVPASGSDQARWAV